MDENPFTVFEMTWPEYVVICENYNNRGDYSRIRQSEFWLTYSFIHFEGFWIWLVVPVWNKLKEGTLSLILEIFFAWSWL